MQGRHNILYVNNNRKKRSSPRREITQEKISVEDPWHQEEDKNKKVNKIISHSA